MAHDVFISHAVEDKPVADAVCGALEGAGLKCWYAPRDVPLGVDYEEAIMDAIVASPLLVLLLSSSSNKSQHVKREVQNALAEDSPTHIITLRIEDVPYSKALRYYLGSAQWLDALTPPLEAHLRRLVEHVRTHLTGAAPPAPQTPREVVREPVAPAARKEAEAWERPAPVAVAPPERPEWFAGRRKFWAASGLAALVGAVALTLAVAGRACDANGPVAAGPTPTPPQQLSAADTPSPAATVTADPAPNSNATATPTPPANTNANARPANANRNAVNVRGNVIREVSTNRSVVAVATPTPTPTPAPDPIDKVKLMQIQGHLHKHEGMQGVSVSFEGILVLRGSVYSKDCMHKALFICNEYLPGCVNKMSLEPLEACKYKEEQCLCQ